MKEHSDQNKLCQTVKIITLLRKIVFVFWMHLHAMVSFTSFVQCFSCRWFHFHCNQRDCLFVFADGNTETPG